jgi:hypothetical protein
MKYLMPLVIFVITAILIAAGTFGPIRLGATTGITSGSALPGLSSAARTPEQAVDKLLSEIQRRNWSVAYAQLVDAGNVDEAVFTRDLTGNNGSLRTLSGLESWELQPLHATNGEAQIRATLRWSTAVGPIREVRNLNVVRHDDVWRVVWPVPIFPNLPAQIVPVNYLRWDLVTPNGEGEWGDRAVDAPHVRIVSMNAVPYQNGCVVMGEVVNEDAIPAFVNVNATLVDGTGKSIAEESSFDKISHILLPKQVSPYRVDFPNISLQEVKNVRMDAKATLVPTSADPVIGVMNQKVDTDGEGRNVLRGTLLNQSGQTVNIPHVIATFYDGNGRVVWVSDGYVDRPLLPQLPEPFAVEIPGPIVGKVQNYHVVVNYYNIAKS